MKKNSLLIAFIFLILVSCQKEKPDSTANMELLTSKDWVVQKEEEKIDAGPWIDGFPFWTPCEKDNRWKFKSNLSMELSEGANPCGSGPPNQIIDIVTWAFYDNETKIIIENDTLSITQLDLNTLVLSSVKQFGNTVVQNRLTYGH